MNDIHESAKVAYTTAIEASSDVWSEIANEIYSYRQLSFTVDSSESLGFDLHQMWGLYADGGNGVCLVFDKKEITRKLSGDYLADDVKYVKEVTSDYFSETDTIDGVRKEIKEHRTEIFFNKKKEWEHEQEFRLIKRCPEVQREGYLSIDSALKFVIVNNSVVDYDSNVWSERIRKLTGALSKFGRHIPMLVYGNALMQYQLSYLYDNGGPLICEQPIWFETEGFHVTTIGHGCDFDV
ncbi:MAG: DUF2971 domain-containing protein [Bacteroides sp.]|nr:DUF2971 domain-containing protein [Bacteroides sp.]